MRAGVAHRRCTLVALEGARGRLTLISPFDDIAPIAQSVSWHRRTWPAVAARVLDAAVAGSPLAPLPGGPRGLVLPGWQLAAVRALDEGVATRVLLADAVGLGKTIQAGLAAALALGQSEPHVLVLTPAGIRDQWTDELSGRLGLEPWVVDPASWRRARATLPPGVNPWSAHRLVLASIDYVKQPDVLAAAVLVPWDLVILDEAHHLTAGSDRRVAADALASRARRVLLVTATPHGGRDEDYAALCAIGARGPRDRPAVLVRRDRTQAGLTPPARLRIVRVPPSTLERAMHEALHRYARMVWAETRGARLAMAWLIKRAASSPAALLRSLEHRRHILEGGHVPTLDAWLPFDEEVDERDEEDCRIPVALGVPGLGDRARELRVLGDLASRAAAAAHTWRKRDWLLRWLRSSREPIVLFTEYRDTLEALVPAAAVVASVAVLHGGLPRGARQEVLARFLRGDARVLAATDVAGEGLNLQSAARTVVSIELPWAPSRLEQRVGRVDRIGQTKVVRAACLAGRDEAEEAVLARVGARATRARLALGGHGDREALELAAAALGVAETEGVEPTGAPPSIVSSPDLPEDGRLAAATSAWLVRAAARRDGRLPRTKAWGDRLPWARLRPTRPGASPPPGVVLLFAARASSARNHVVAETLVALHVTLAADARRMPAGRLLEALVRLAAPHAATAAGPPLAETMARFAGRTRAALDRALARDEPSGTPPEAPVQAGLFDRRAIAEAARDRAIRDADTARDAMNVADLRVDLETCRAEPPCAIAAFVCW